MNARPVFRPLPFVCRGAGVRSGVPWRSGLQLIQLILQAVLYPGPDRGDVVPVRNAVAVAPVGVAILHQVLQFHQPVDVVVLLALAQAQGFPELEAVELIVFALLLNKGLQFFKELPKAAIQLVYLQQDALKEDITDRSVPGDRRALRTRRCHALHRHRQAHGRRLRGQPRLSGG